MVKSTFDCGGKIRVNWTIDRDIINLLEQARIFCNNSQSVSSIVCDCIRKSLTDPKVLLKNKLRYHQVKLMEYHDKLETMESFEIPKSEIKNILVSTGE